DPLAYALYFAFGGSGLILGIVGRIDAPIHKKSGERRAEWAIAIPPFTFLLMLILVPVCSNVEEARAREATRNSLKEIVFALHEYSDAHDRRFPPAAHGDRDGRPLLSWRVLVLPYLAQKPLYDQFRLDEPWDSPHNIRLLERIPPVFNLPLPCTLPPFSRPP